MFNFRCIEHAQYKPNPTFDQTKNDLNNFRVEQKITILSRDDNLKPFLQKSVRAWFSSTSFQLLFCAFVIVWQSLAISIIIQYVRKHTIPNNRFYCCYRRCLTIFNFAVICLFGCLFAIILYHLLVCINTTLSIICDSTQLDFNKYFPIKNMIIISTLVRSFPCIVVNGQWKLKQQKIAIKNE